MKNRVVIKLNSMISFAGEIVEVIKDNNKIEKYILKPSRKSEVVLYIPSNEISIIYAMDGKVIEGEDVYVNGII